jgi:hypothetical protein
MGITYRGRRYEVHTESELMLLILWMQTEAA